MVNCLVPRFRHRRVAVGVEYATHVDVRVRFNVTSEAIEKKFSIAITCLAFKSEGAEVPERDGEVLYLKIRFCVRRFFVVFGLYTIKSSFLIFLVGVLRMLLGTAAMLLIG